MQCKSFRWVAVITTFILIIILNGPTPPAQAQTREGKPAALRFDFGTGKVAPMHPDAFEAFKLPASPLATDVKPLGN
jgi:hypothetical protein